MRGKKHARSLEVVSSSLRSVKEESYGETQDVLALRSCHGSTRARRLVAERNETQRPGARCVYRMELARLRLSLGRPKIRGMLHHE